MRRAGVIPRFPSCGSVRLLLGRWRTAKRSRRWIVGSLLVLLAIVAFVVGIRIRAATRRAEAFVQAINARDFARAGGLLEPQDQPLPDPWAHPGHWGDDGALEAHADLAPLQVSQALCGVRHVVAMVHLDALSPHGMKLFLHEFKVTSRSLTRVAKKPDSAEYPITVRPVSTEEPLEIPPDVAGVPTLDLCLAGDAQKRYFLIGNVGTPSRRAQGRRLLVIMPGGDGGAGFSPFVRRIYQRAFNDDWLVAQMVAPRWDRKQAVVWPTQGRPYLTARFTTEQLFDGVVEDVASHGAIDRREVYVLAWSSGGPAAYAIALGENPKIAGAFIAMSIFRAGDYSQPKTAPMPAFYLLQSPDDKITAFRHAQGARDWLSTAGARVRLEPYAGGHGWRGNPFQMISDGVNWLVQSTKE